MLKLKHSVMVSADFVKRRCVPLGLAIFCSSGCAALPPAQVGQTIGTIAGAAALPGLGAPIGALAGLLAGMVVQNQIDKTTENRERKDLGHELGTGKSGDESAQPPSGEPTRVWVDETTQNGRVVAGHFDARSLP